MKFNDIERFKDFLILFNDSGKNYDKTIFWEDHFNHILKIKYYQYPKIKDLKFYYNLFINEMIGASNNDCEFEASNWRDFLIGYDEINL